VETPPRATAEEIQAGRVANTLYRAQIQMMRDRSREPMSADMRAAQFEMAGQIAPWAKAVQRMEDSKAGAGGERNSEEEVEKQYLAERLANIIPIDAETCLALTGNNEAGLPARFALMLTLLKGRGKMPGHAHLAIMTLEQMMAELPQNPERDRILQEARELAGQAEAARRARNPGAPPPPYAEQIVEPGSVTERMGAAVDAMAPELEAQGIKIDGVRGQVILAVLNAQTAEIRRMIAEGATTPEVAEETMRAEMRRQWIIEEDETGTVIRRPGIVKVAEQTAQGILDHRLFEGGGEVAEKMQQLQVASTLSADQQDVVFTRTSVKLYKAIKGGGRVNIATMIDESIREMGSE
jgi:hypothetical protein